MGTCLRCFAVILISPGGSPEHPHRRRRRSRLDIAAYRRYAIALAQRDVRHHGGVEHQCPFVDLPLLGKALCARIGAAHRLHALVARPAGARLVAGGSEIWRHERIKDVHLDPATMSASRGNKAGQHCASQLLRVTAVASQKCYDGSVCGLAGAQGVSVPCCDRPRRRAQTQINPCASCEQLPT